MLKANVSVHSKIVRRALKRTGFSFRVVPKQSLISKNLRRDFANKTYTKLKASGTQ